MTKRNFSVVVTNGHGDQATVRVAVRDDLHPLRYTGPAILKARRMLPDAKPWVVGEWTETTNGGERKNNMSKKDELESRAASKAAARLGRMARGVPKVFTPEEIERRTELLKAARKKRWPAKTAVAAK